MISHAVWLYFHISLNFRDVEELMTERDVVLTYETIWQWYLRFGQTYVKGLKCRRGKTGDKRHLDELFLEINGKTHYLWRAVGNVLDRREEEVWQGLKGDLLETQPLGDDNTVAVCEGKRRGWITSQRSSACSPQMR